MWKSSAVSQAADRPDADAADPRGAGGAHAVAASAGVRETENTDLILYIRTTA